MTLLDTADAARSFPGFASNGDAQSGRTLRQRTARPLSEERLTRMSKTTGKRGFVPPQASKDITSLDFQSAVEAFNRGLAEASRFSGDDNAVEANADAIAAAADRIISIPTSEPRCVAEKIRAFGWMECLTVDMADPAAQQRIVTGNHDSAKRLLAIYLDLTTPAPQAQPAPDLAALVQRARGAHSAFEKDCDTYSDPVLAAQQGRALTRADERKYRALRNRREQAFEALRSYPAKTTGEALTKLNLCQALMGDFEEDVRANLDALESDVKRWALSSDTAPPAVDRSAWDAARAEYERTAPLAESSRYSKDAAGDAAWEQADDNHVAAFGVLVRTPSPDAEANRFKLRAILRHGHDESMGLDEADTVHGLQRMLDEPGVDGPWPLVYVYQDAIRQSGDLSSPLLTPLRSTPADEVAGRV